MERPAMAIHEPSATRDEEPRAGDADAGTAAGIEC
jgi:hypothetical protein